MALLHSILSELAGAAADGEVLSRTVFQQDTSMHLRAFSFITLTCVNCWDRGWEGSVSTTRLGLAPAYAGQARQRLQYLVRDGRAGMPRGYGRRSLVAHRDV